MANYTDEGLPIIEPGTVDALERDYAQETREEGEMMGVDFTQSGGYERLLNNSEYFRGAMETWVGKIAGNDEIAERRGLQDPAQAFAYGFIMANELLARQGEINRLEETVE